MTEAKTIQQLRVMFANQKQKLMQDALIAADFKPYHAAELIDSPPTSFARDFKALTLLTVKEFREKHLAEQADIVASTGDQS